MVRSQNVQQWLKSKDIIHKTKALEYASTIFSESDDLSVHTLEAIYGQESSFGSDTVLEKDVRGSYAAVGHFQIEKNTAGKDMITTKNNDERFDVDQSSHFAAKYLKHLDIAFSKTTYIYTELKYGKIHTIPIENKKERKKFDLAAYNAGQKRIAIAQLEAQIRGKNPESWDDVKQYLVDAGASVDKEHEILVYVDNILGYEKEFTLWSEANKGEKNKPSRPYPSSTENGRWITTKDGNKVFID